MEGCEDGLAIFLHVENADSTHSSLTRDIDVMIQRDDLARVVAIAEEHGFRHSAGLDMLLYGETNSAPNAIPLLFTGEKVKAAQLEVHPTIRPVRVGIHGQDFLVIPVGDLVRMKLCSNRDKDRVHVRGMDAAGLITQEVEQGLNEDLRSRIGSAAPHWCKFDILKLWPRAAGLRHRDLFGKV